MGKGHKLELPGLVGRLQDRQWRESGRGGVVQSHSQVHLKSCGKREEAGCGGAHFLIPAHERQGQVELCEVEDSMVSLLSEFQVNHIVRLCLQEGKKERKRVKTCPWNLCISLCTAVIKTHNATGGHGVLRL